MVSSYVPLAVRSGYSFLNSTLPIEAAVDLARRHGLSALALADEGNLHGAVEFAQTARQAGIKPILGTTLTLEGRPLSLYVADATGYRNLCRLLSATSRGSGGAPGSILTQSGTEVPHSRRWREAFGVRRFIGALDPGEDASWVPWTSNDSASGGVLNLGDSPSPVLPPSLSELRRTSRTPSPPRRGRGKGEGRTPPVRGSWEDENLPPSGVHLHLTQLDGLTDGLIAVGTDSRLADRFGDRFYFAIRTPEEVQSRGASRPVLALPVHYAEPGDRWKWDVVQSIRTHTLLRQKHPDKVLDGEFHFRSPAEMAALGRDHPEFLSNTFEIADRCAFDLPFGPPQFPAFAPPDGSSPRTFLRALVRTGLRHRYGARAETLRAQVEEELAIIAEVGYEEYFLVVWDLLQECRRRGIEWITRGSAADSLVCYCLGISEVCPIRFDLYFRRFLNRERMKLNKLPDIDIDFAHDRKDDVVDLVFEKYGAEHAAVVGGFSTFQARSAVADVAKVLGVSEFQIRRFTEHFPWTGARDIVEALAQSEENRDLPVKEEPYRTALEMAAFLDGFPRYPKMHPCGVVLSRQPMMELTPTFASNKGYPTTHFDMDAVEAIGLVKIDILAQGGLAAMRDVRAMLAARDIEVDLNQLKAAPMRPRPGLRQPSAALPFTDVRKAPEDWRSPKPGGSSDNSREAPSSPLFRSARTSPIGRARTPCAPPGDALNHGAHGVRALPCGSWNDPAVWDMIAGGGARAVHHIESPAMIGLCRQCNVRDIDGLIAIVSVIRPGAANEQKKRKFTRRYQNLEPITYPHPSLEACLRSTFGLVVYEEHILQICEAFAGLPPGRADVLRRALGKMKRQVIEEIRREFVACARARGHADEKIVEVWDLVRGFSGYAFCKAHSTAYGVEAYQSAWLKRYYPVEFMAAVLSNGKGFYHPIVYVLECHRLGIPLRPPDVNQPGPQFAVEGTAIRVPLTRVKGLTERTRTRLVEERARGVFASLADFYRRVVPAPEEMEAMIRMGAFDGFGKPRTVQFWEAQHLYRAFGGVTSPAQGWLLPAPATDRLPDVPLEEPTRRQRLEWERELLDFAVSGHPLELHEKIAWDTYCPVARLGEHVGREVVTCGLVIEQRIHHQVTGETMKFLTLADRTGMVETELFAPTYRSYGLATVRYPVLEITATVEPFENGRGFSLRVHRAGKPRMKGA